MPVAPSEMPSSEATMLGFTVNWVGAVALQEPFSDPKPGPAVKLYSPVALIDPPLALNAVLITTP